ncbi:MAG: hypothetical protein J1E64_07360 [Acetatifactor sp.]|nr:hypothetical protein [Acetatifactor sp.]
MLGKLIKYEWKSVSKFCFIALLVLVGITLLGSIYYISPLWNGLMDLEESGALGEGAIIPFLTGMTSFFAYILVVVGVMYGAYLYLLIRFYRSMYSNEGYLTHTLPVTPQQLLISKLLVSGVWCFITEVVACLSIFLLVFVFIWGLIPAGERHWLMPEMFSGMKMTFEMAGINLTSFWLAVFLAALIGPFTSMSLYFCGISLGQLAKSHRGLMAVLGCVGVYFVNWIVNFIVQMIVSMGTMITMMSQYEYGRVTVMSPIGYYVQLVVMLAMGVGAFFLTRYIVSRKLNLT